MASFQGNDLKHALLFQPINKCIRYAHRRKATLADEQPVVEEMALFDLAQGDRAWEAAHKSDVDNPALALFGVRARLGGHAREPHDGGLASAVIDEDVVARPHALDCAHGLGIA